MLFNSVEFVVFLPICFFFYWFVLGGKTQAQNLFLLVASYVFYGWWDWRFLSLLFVSSIIDYVLGLRISQSENPRQRKFLLFLSILCNLGLLGFFKYFNFFATSFAASMKILGWQVDELTLSIVLPVGISFYTFQTMSYTLDVYRGVIKPTRNLISFLAFVSFFPQLVAGPIERASHLLPQFHRNRNFQLADGIAGLHLIIWGLFKKVVVADNCAPVVNTIFGSYTTASGYELMWAVFLFAFQIYGDFSGYSDIARGCSKLFGFDLMVNFRTPYFSTSIAEFWRRWHISLSTWFRDYLYLPLGGAHLGRLIQVRNVIIVFLVSGFWHGANWTYIVWGCLNAVYMLPGLFWHRVPGQKPLPFFKLFTKSLLTFILICFSWIFFRSATVSDALEFIKIMVTWDYSVFTWPPIKSYLPIVLAYLLLFDGLSRLQSMDEYLGSKKRWIGMGVDISTLLLIILFGSFSKQDFIYFQF